MRSVLAVLLVASACPLASQAAGPRGYYREPALHGDTVVFVSEGDLFKVRVEGGVATRLTTGLGEERDPAISPDGTSVAFVGTYDGPAEVYVMPLDGGLPRRRTWDGHSKAVVGWTPDGRVLVATRRHSGMPSTQLEALDVSHEDVTPSSVVPLAQAADGSYAPDGTLYFTRFAFQGSHTKRYRGGTAQNVWRFRDGAAEAEPLTADWPGTSRRPMWSQGRVVFVTDRDGTLNLWSMDPGGGDLRQLTRHDGWDVREPSLDRGRVAYRLGADLRLLDVASGADREIPITLESDLDQTREHRVDKPIDYLTASHPSPDGDRVALTARGQVFVVPHGQGRLVEASRAPGVRYRDARFMPDGTTLLALSDESGEVEVWTAPANGAGERKRLTRDADVLRWEAVPSPDGRFVAHTDKNQRLWVLETATGTNRRVASSDYGDLTDLAWSPDGRWLAFVEQAANLFRRVMLYDAERGEAASPVPATSDRYDSYAPAWSPDGKWLYLLSDRNLHSIVGSVWGSYQPEPYLDKTTRIYHIALRSGTRSPFAPDDELHAKQEPDKKKEENEKGAGRAKDPREKVRVEIDVDGIAGRLAEVPIPAGNYAGLALNEKALFTRSSAAGERRGDLVAIPIRNRDLEPKTVVPGVTSFELTADRKKLLARKGDDLFVVDAEPAEAKLDKARLDLSAWRLTVDPREEWRQMFVEAWRLERDYFWDTNMSGIDWAATRDKYLPLVDRVHAREELSDVFAQMISELSALHMFVRGGDEREPRSDVVPASLGAVLERDEAAGGYRVKRVYRTDPDRPDRRSPLARPGVEVSDGDVIAAIDGVATLSVPDAGALLRDKAARQVLLRVAPRAGGATRDVVVEPITPAEDADLRYREWEYTRRQRVEQQGGGAIGYVHLRAMSAANFTEWAEGYYPVFTRAGLIVDVRNNRGGNIDSWILSRLLRRAWFYWSTRVGDPPIWNMQYAFRGHVVVLCNESTASDGEAFTEGIRRLGIGKIIGTRTWGGEIWLSSSNVLVDRGIATAAEYGVYGPEGEWLIEGHGVDPDTVVDNLPHATYEGADAQLDAAIRYLEDEIRANPVPPPTVPPKPEKRGHSPIPAAPK